MFEIGCDPEIADVTSELAEVALESNLDLREYANKVKDQLKVLEDDSIDTYVKMGPDVFCLHRKISACCKTLERMENILLNFHKDLGTISSGIQDLQSRSLTMHQRLQNRQAVRGELSQFLSDMVVPEELIKHILLTPVTEQDFIENLHELDHKITFVLNQSLNEYPSYQDVSIMLQKLKQKAIMKIREFLLEKIQLLRKPLANYQIPQNHLLKYRYFYEFLLVHELPTARDLRLSYVNTMEKIYFSYFKTYSLKLLKLQFDSSPDKDDLVGKKVEDLSGSIQSALAPSISITGVRASTGQVSVGVIRPGQFGLVDRAEALLTREGLQNTILLPHAATKSGCKYPIEQIFRSVNYALFDTASREYLFLGDFFLHGFGFPVSVDTALNDFDDVSPNVHQAKTSDDKKISSEKVAESLFKKVFQRTVVFIETSVMPQMINNGSCDILGLLICVQLVHAILNLGNERSFPVMNSYWDKILGMLWPKVVDRLEAHIVSLRNLDFSHFSQAVSSCLPHSSRGSSINESAAINLSPRAYCLIRPHPVARRYTELAASLHNIGQARPLGSSPSTSLKESSTTSATNVRRESLLTVSASLDARILLSLSRMHVEFETVCERLSKALPRERLRLVFLINNFDLFISVLSEKGAANCLEVSHCREVVTQHTVAYIDQALLPYFGSMIGFLNSVEGRRPGKGVEADDRNEEGRVTHIVKGFNIDWKNSLEKINSEIMQEFANFTLGTQIFQALLSQLVQLYHRFQKVMTLPPYNEMPIRNQIVSIHQILSEIKRFKSNF